MRIAVVTPSLSLGGAERSLIKLICLVSPLVERVDIISLASIDESMARELPDGVRVTCMEARSSGSPILWLRVGLYLRKLKPELIVGWSTYANFVAIVAKRFHSAGRVILSERNYVPQALARINVPPIRRRVVLWLIRQLYRRADLVTANSQDSVKFLRRYIGRGPAYRLLPNVVDLEDIDARAASSVQSMVDDIREPRILALGRLDYQKGFDILLRAFSIVHGRHSLWTLVIVGDGPQKDSLMELCKSLGLESCVHWVGAVSNPFPYFRWANVVVVPSRYEGFPNVPLEAMAVGKAVICSDCKTGPRDLTGDGRYGRLVPVGDVNALAQAIIEVASSADAAAEMGRAARVHVQATYGASVMRNRYAEILGMTG